MTRVENKIRWAMAALLFAAPMLVWADTPTTPPTLAQQVRHQLLMDPYYNVFDNLNFKISDHTVTLLGQVTRPVVKEDAETLVRSIPGVTAVKNDIEVLPVSPMDSRIRWQELRAIYRYGALSRYAMGPVPSIHIIVKNGHVTLEGVVQNRMDKEIAGIRANTVPGVFSVTNNLVIGKA
jgi:hyperosmotically inducible protein